MEGLKKKNWKFGLEAKAETFQIAKIHAAACWSSLADVEIKGSCVISF